MYVFACVCEHIQLQLDTNIKFIILFFFFFIIFGLGSRFHFNDGKEHSYMYGMYVSMYVSCTLRLVPSPCLCVLSLLSAYLQSNNDLMITHGMSVLL